MQFGRFEIIRELGRGGFGTVYQAHDTIFGLDRALKLVYPQLSADKHFCNRLEQEINQQLLMEHPNLVPIYETGIVEGQFFVVMKYFPGGSLADRLQNNGGLNEKEILRILRDFYAGLQYAHNNHVVHGDLKPANILFDEYGTACISDIGFAKSLTDENNTRLSASEIIVGTPAYIAPEIWRGATPTFATDIYAVGCILYEMLTGEVLFKGDSPAEVLLKQLRVSPEFSSYLPQKWLPVLQRALKKDSNERFATVNELVDAVQSLSESDHFINLVSVPPKNSRLRLGRYELIKELGAGGFGTVFQAHDTILEIDRAVKVVHPVACADKSFRECLLKEFINVFELRHPNLIPLYELDEIDNRLFIVMKYLPGGSLREKLIKNGGLEVNQARKTFIEICAGLEFVHKNNIFPVNPVPAKVLFDKSDTACLTLLNLSKCMRKDSTISASSQEYFANIAYMAPEIWRGGELSVATDIYNLGCILYEMLTGQVLFGATSPADAMLKHVVYGPEISQKLDGDFKNIILMAIDQDQEKRFASVRKMREAVESVTISKHYSSEMFNLFRKVPKKFGRFEIVKELGRGGFGVVYEVLDTKMDVVRALKIVRPVGLVDETFINRFIHEARIAASIDHPNLVPVYDSGEIEGQYFIVMKYLPGGSLKKRITKQGHLDEREALSKLLEICAGLEYLHMQGIVHRDLKPANILFDEHGSARINDMGFAKHLGNNDSDELPSLSGISGTPYYMAPEIWERKNASPASDVYSLACIYYEMLTGKVLFCGNNILDVMARHTLLTPSYSNDLPSKFLQIMQIALNKEPEGRFSSVRSMAEMAKNLYSIR